MRLFQSLGAFFAGGWHMGRRGVRAERRAIASVVTTRFACQWRAVASSVASANICGSVSR